MGSLDVDGVKALGRWNGARIVRALVLDFRDRDWGNRLNSYIFNQMNEPSP